MANFIKIKNNREEDISCIEGFGKAAWTFVSSIFEREWDILKSGDDNKSFQQKIAEEFTNNIPVNKLRRNISKTSTLKLVNFLNIPPSPIFPRLTKE